MTTGEAVTGVTRHWGTLRPGSLAHSLRLVFGEEKRRLVPPFVMIRSGASSAHSSQLAASVSALVSRGFVTQTRGYIN